MRSPTPCCLRRAQLEGPGAQRPRPCLGEAGKCGSGQPRVTAHVNWKAWPGCGRGWTPRTGRWSRGPALWGTFPAKGVIGDSEWGERSGRLRRSGEATPWSVGCRPWLGLQVTGRLRVYCHFEELPSCCSAAAPFCLPDPPHPSNARGVRLSTSHQPLFLPNVLLQHPRGHGAVLHGGSDSHPNNTELLLPGPWPLANLCGGYRIQV